MENQKGVKFGSPIGENYAIPKKFTATIDIGRWLINPLCIGFNSVMGRRRKQAWQAGHRERLSERELLAIQQLGGELPWRE